MMSNRIIEAGNFLSIKGSAISNESGIVMETFTLYYLDDIIAKVEKSKIHKTQVRFLQSFCSKQWSERDFANVVEIIKQIQHLPWLL